MQLKPFPGIVLTLLLTLCAPILGAQSVPSADTRNYPYSVGVGISGFNMDFMPPSFQGQMLGVGAWADWQPNKLPFLLQGLGIQAEAHLTTGARSQILLDTEPNSRELTVGGGPIYQVHHWHNFRPYVRGSYQYGTIHFTNQADPSYMRDDRLVKSVATGVDFRAPFHLWLRTEYEYQQWPHLFGVDHHPQIVSVGLVYRFSRSLHNSELVPR